MPTITNNILAIDPGTREIGFAVLSGNELLDYGVKRVSKQSTTRALMQKVDVIVTRLFVQYSPALLAIKQPVVVQYSGRLVEAVGKQIKSTGERHGLTIYEFEPKAIRQFVCQSPKATKQDMAKIIADRCLELARYADKKNKEEALYWGRMFDAIAVGLMSAEEVKST